MKYLLIEMHTKIIQLKNLKTDCLLMIIALLCFPEFTLKIQDRNHNYTLEIRRPIKKCLNFVIIFVTRSQYSCSIIYLTCLSTQELLFSLLSPVKTLLAIFYSIIIANISAVIRMLSPLLKTKLFGK